MASRLLPSLVSHMQRALSTCVGIEVFAVCPLYGIYGHKNGNRSKKLEATHFIPVGKIEYYLHQFPRYVHRSHPHFRPYC